MRKKNRYVTKGAAGTAFFFMIIDGFSQYLELKEEGKSFWKNLDLNRAFKAGAKGLVIGGLLGYILYKVHQWEERDLPFCPDNHLHKVLNIHSAQSDAKFVSTAKKLIRELKEKLAFEFGNDLVDKPLDFGSSKTKTAIGGSSDFDILVPFKKNVGTIVDLYEDVHEFMVDNYESDFFDIRKQRHSVGLTFDDGEVCVHVDVVPARERNNYQETGDVTILRRSKGFWETPTYIKTNIWKKRNVVVNQPETRRIVKLMKIYRGAANFYLNSPVVLALVKEAMDKNMGYINSSIYNNWTLAMGYVADQLQTRTRVTDIANSNNNLLEKVSQNQRNSIIARIFKDLESLEKSPQYLKEIFEIE